MSIQWEVLGDTREGLIAQFEGMDFQSENLRHLLTSADILRVGRVGMAAASVRVRIILDRSRVGGNTIPALQASLRWEGKAATSARIICREDSGVEVGERRQTSEHLLNSVDIRTVGRYAAAARVRII